MKKQTFAYLIILATYQFVQNVNRIDVQTVNKDII
jgi:hypothetical protein